MRTRESAALAAILVAIGLCAGCGGDGSDEDQVRDVVTGFVEAGNDRDAAEVCSLLATDQVKSVEGLGPGGSCAAVLTGIFSEAEDVGTELEIQDVRISGDRATVDATITSAGGEPQAKSVLLVKEDGEWKIASAGL